MRAALARPADLTAAASRAGGAGAGLLKAGLLLCGLVAAALAARGLGAGFLANARATPMGAATLVLSGALLAAAGVPRQAVAFAGGYAFGAWRGGALALVAQMLGCALDFWWARTIARAWATRFLRGRLARADRFLALRPFTATLTLRLLPVGNNLVLNLLAGVSGLRPAPFLAASLLGYVPQTAVFALAGSGTHLNRSVQLGLGAALFLASAALGMVLLRARNAPITDD